MTIDVYTSTGTKSGTLTLPSALFEARINEGLMHQAVVRLQSNRRTPVAHTKGRGEIQGSTRKIFQQKGTGRARRGPIRSPVVRGGGKAFGPNKNASFAKDMPRTMRRSALFSSLSKQAKGGNILGLKDYPNAIKTKTLVEILEKLPVELGRKIVVVLPEKMNALERSAGNIPNVDTVLVQYLNPEHVLSARHLIFLVDAVKEAEKLFAPARKRETAKITKDATTKTSTPPATSKTS